MKIIISETQYRQLISESGLREINNLAKRYKKAKIYFHQDLDGVTTALAMKNYLEQHGIEVVDAEIIQYGDKEFGIKKPEGEGEIMPVLVDFAHGKPMFVIHTDHHDSQAGAEDTKTTSFKASRSNVETISQSVSPKEIFPSDDLLLISIVDSANFAQYDITPDMVMNYMFRFDKEESLKRNKMMLGLVINKLLLAYKNKPRFLEEIVLTAKPSLLSILNVIRRLATEKGYASPEDMASNKEAYLEKRKDDPSVIRMGNIITQYGIGSVSKAGSYDRYTPFRNNPDADFLVTGFPFGMVQASCNPFKKDRALKGVDLGRIKDEVLEILSPELKSQILTFGGIKRISEMGADYSSVGFTLKDMIAIYGKSPSYKVNGGQKILEILDNISGRLYRQLSDKQKELLDRITINGYDVINANSGGHKCITNISGLNFLYKKNKSNDPNQEENDIIRNYEGRNNFVNDIKSKLIKFGNLSDKQREVAITQIQKETGVTQEKTESIKTSVELVKKLQQIFVNLLNDYVNKEQPITESRNKKKDVVEMIQSHISKKKTLSESDWKLILKELNCVVDNRGQWEFPGECTLIHSKHITMENVDFPLLGIDETGKYKVMIPEKKYTFDGEMVLEIPMVGKYGKLAKKILDF
jgi:hypothetical protein